MAKILIPVITLFTLSVMSYGQVKNPPVPVILDSDMGDNFDDIGALTVLHALSDKGEAKILATIADNQHPENAFLLDVINTYFDRPHIPIGTAQNDTTKHGQNKGWEYNLVENHPHHLKSKEEAFKAVNLYRKVLSHQPDSSVTVISIGYFTNLARLLRSEPDQYSDLTGQQLIAKKVKKLVAMGGEYPEGKEYNIAHDIPAAQAVVRNWPTPIIFSGFEIGEDVKTGAFLAKTQDIKTNPVKEAYLHSIPSKEQAEGNPSWDLITVLVAVRGAEPYYDLVSGKNAIDPEGENTWHDSKSGHYYLKENTDSQKTSTVIDALMEEGISKQQ